MERRSVRQRVRRVVVGLFLLAASYPCSYGLLRATHCLVHREYVSFGCSPKLMAELQAEFPDIDDLSVELYRHDIGCGPIRDQPEKPPLLTLLFAPACETELYLRGYDTDTLYLFSNKVHAWDGYLESQLIAEREIRRRPGR